jgi:hypothetical protein
MVQSRVLLSPSLVDGTPNSMFEAMACGAFPIVSPLATITPIVSDRENVLFARNLYQEEIAQALVKAMTDDGLVDAAAERNLELVNRIADRAEIGPRVIAYYEGLWKEAPHADLLNQIEELQSELADRDAQIADRDAQIRLLNSHSWRWTWPLRKLKGWLIQ